MNSYHVIKRPLVTEKASRAKEQGNYYAFEVAKNATKTDIKRAVQELFKVKVCEVNVMRMHGKPKRAGKTGRYMLTSDWKKAMVKLQDGQKIEYFEGV